MIDMKSLSRFSWVCGLLLVFAGCNSGY